MTTSTIPLPTERAATHSDVLPRDCHAEKTSAEQLPLAGLRLLHVVTVPISLNFFRGQIGYLRSHGLDVQAVSSPGEEAELAREREGITVHEVPMNRGISPLADLVFALAFDQINAPHQAGHRAFAHAQGWSAWHDGGAAHRHARRDAFNLWSAANDESRDQTASAQHDDAVLVLAGQNAFGATANRCGSNLIDSKLCRADKIVVLGHGSSNGIESQQKFNPDSYSPEDRLALRSEYGIPADAFTVCFVGRIVADKGMRELAGAWRILRDKHPTLHLLIVGPFEPQDPLEPVDEELLRTDPRIHLTGMRQDVPRHLAAVDLLVNPSYREGFNVALLEAAAMGLPVVASRVPGCADPVVEGVTGTLVPVRDAAALAQAIENYLLDQTLREQHGRAGRERIVRDFQPQQIWQELERNYRELIPEKEPA